MEETTSACLLRDLRGHSGDVNCCCWSPVDQTLCSCGGEGALRLWAVPAGNELRKLVAHSFYVNACAYSPAGDLLATASTDCTVKLWSTSSWSAVGELHGHEGAVRWCCFSLDGCLLATASSDDSARVWEVGSLQSIATLTGHTGSVTCCVFAPSGWMLVTSSTSGEVILFDVFAQRNIKRLKAHDEAVNTMHIAPPSAEWGEEVVMLATAGNDYYVRLWKMRLGERNASVAVHQLAELSLHSGPVYSCAFHPTLRLLVSGSADQKVVLWNLDSLKPAKVLHSHSRYVTHCSFSPDGKYLATASNDKVVKLWQLQTGDAEPADDAEKNTSDTTSGKKEGSSLIAEVSWSVDGVCAWLQSLSEQQDSGQPSHPDDIRAAQRIAGALQTVTLNPDQQRVGELCCAITQEVMRDPVVAQDGYTYERSAITGWLSKGRRTSPVNNLPLPTTILIPNRLVKTLIDKQNKS